LTDTEAQVIISVEGACMSAATLLFMCGHQYEISPHSVFMFHNYSSGMVGKGGEMFDRVNHERSWSEKLFQDVYADFLTEREIKQILDNKDLWMDADEVIKRLKKKIKKNEKVDKSEQEG
jgi:ATP-dependent protease ClpP protease subunit